MTFLRDMSQQADNIRFIRHSARIDCRTCFYFKEKRENLEYDIEDNDRHHWETLEQREYVQDLKNTKEIRVFLRDVEVRLESSFIAKLLSVLDLIHSRSYDASHFE